MRGRAILDRPKRAADGHAENDQQKAGQVRPSWDFGDDQGGAETARTGVAGWPRETATAGKLRPATTRPQNATQVASTTIAV